MNAVSAVSTASGPMLHCILRRPPRAALLVDGLRWIPINGLGALVTHLDPAEIRAADKERLQGYADLIARLHAQQTLIPMRFGCLLADDAAVVGLLKGHRQRLLETLDRLDDCVEFSVRLLLPPESQAAPSVADPDPRPGHGHLAAIRLRLQEETLAAERAATARDILEQALAGLFVDLRQEFGPVGERYLLSLYFLVPRQAADRFVAQLRLHPDLVAGAGLVTGPWPPFNFVGALDDVIHPLA